MMETWVAHISTLVPDYEIVDIYSQMCYMDQIMQ